MAEKLTLGKAADIADRVALGFAAYYEKIGYDQFAKDVFALYDYGEGGVVADTAWDTCEVAGLPVPSDLVDEYMKLVNDDPEEYKRELDVISRLERTDPIWVVAKSA